MNERQISVLEWLEKIKCYAKEQCLPTRIINHIDECKIWVLDEKPKWNEINAEVNDLLASIEYKTMPISEPFNEDGISVQDVKAEVTKMAKRCHNRNETSMYNMTEQKNFVVKEAYREMKEIFYVEKYLNELQDGGKYLSFFDEIRSKYEKNVLQSVKELLDNISRNYDYMFEHMKSMFLSIGGYKHNVGNEKFHYEFDERKDGLLKKMQSDTLLYDFGGDNIITFAKMTRAKIKKITRKINARRTFLIWLPVLLLLCYFLFTKIDIENVQTVKDSVEILQEENASFGEITVNLLKELEKQLIQLVKFAIENISKVLKFIFSATMLVILLAIYIYKTYVKKINEWSDEQICKKCGEYMKSELIEFENDDLLYKKYESAVVNMVEEYEKQILIILNNLFFDSEFETDEAEEKKINSFIEIKKEWDTLKYEQGDK